MDPVLIFIIIVVALGGAVWFFNNRGESSSVSAPAPKPAPAPAPVVEAEVKKVPTKTVLNKMSKKELDNFAKAEWDIKLDARLKKDDMIKAFQKEAKAQQK